MKCLISYLRKYQKNYLSPGKIYTIYDVGRNQGNWMCKRTTTWTTSSTSSVEHSELSAVRGNNRCYYPKVPHSPLSNCSEIPLSESLLFVNGLLWAKERFEGWRSSNCPFCSTKTTWLSSLLHWLPWSRKEHRMQLNCRRAMRSSRRRSGCTSWWVRLRPGKSWPWGRWGCWRSAKLRQRRKTLVSLQRLQSRHQEECHWPRHIHWFVSELQTFADRGDLEQKIQNELIDSVCDFKIAAEISWVNFQLHQVHFESILQGIMALGMLSPGFMHSVCSVLGNL